MNNEFHLSRHTLILSDYLGLNYGKNLEETVEYEENAAYFNCTEPGINIVHREFFVNNYQVNVAYVIDCTDEKWEDILKCKEFWNRENQTSAT